MAAERGERLAENVAHFARVLRKAGLPVGPDRTLLALEVIEAVGLDRREDVHAALGSVMVRARDQQHIFDAAFAAFWADPHLLEKVLHLMLPTISGRGSKEHEKKPRRLEEALRADQSPAVPPVDPAHEEGEEHQIDAVMTFSDRERLRHADFESMSTDEYLQASRVAQTIDLPLRPILIRRARPATRGRVDLRRTLLRMARAPDTVAPAYSCPQRKRPALVLMVDVSGSMERYARIFLHFAHGLTRRHKTTHSFVFGTRLTPLTAVMRERDPDEAMKAAAREIEDWSGGTRIAGTLHEFNWQWARRILSRNAALILVTDGLDRDENGDLRRESALLSRFAHEFVWLNPLLRYDGFEPRAAGIRALLGSVDRFLPVHNLDSIESLGRSLGRQRHRGQFERKHHIGRPR
ncbi:MAG: VWA domain-containing protein [Burkholderiaceae bacterium]|nr:VWA domain-containing protein [Burkholderiaceae bacterium]